MVLSRHYKQQPVIISRNRPDISQCNVEQLFNNGEFRDLLANLLVGSVKIPTVAYDSMDHVGVDPRWDIFYKHSEYLKTTFPKV